MKKVNRTFVSDCLNAAKVSVTFLQRNAKHDMTTTQDWLEQFCFSEPLQKEGSVEKMIAEWNGRKIYIPEYQANTKRSEILIEIEA